MIQLKVLGDGLNLWHKKPGAYWIKVPHQSTKRILPIFEKVTPLARQEQSRTLEELRERAWSLPWPIVEAAALVENQVTVVVVVAFVVFVVVVVVVSPNQLLRRLPSLRTRLLLSLLLLLSLSLSLSLLLLPWPIWLADSQLERTSTLG